MDHDHVAWGHTLGGGVLFTEDSDGDMDAIAGKSLLTPAVITAHIVNFDKAGRHYRSGLPDDDFLAPRTTVTDHLPPGQPTVTVVEGNRGLWRSSMIGWWRFQADKVQARDIADVPAIAKTMFDWFAAANVIAVLRDYAFDADRLVATVLEDNRRHINGDIFGPESSGGVGWAEMLAAYTVSNGGQWTQLESVVQEPSLVLQLDELCHLGERLHAPLSVVGTGTLTALGQSLHCSCRPHGNGGSKEIN